MVQIPGAEGRWRASIRLTLQIVLTIGLTWLIADRIGLSLQEVRQLDAALPEPEHIPLTASALLLFAGFLLSTRIWGKIVQELGGIDPGALASARIVLTANLGRYVPGKLWQVAGLAVLSRRAGVPATLGMASAVLVQLLGLLATGILGFPLVASWIGREGETWMPPSLALLALAVLLAAVSLPSLLTLGLRLSARFTSSLPEALPPLGRSFGARWLLAHLVLWVVYGAAFLLFVRGLGLEAGFFEVVPSFAAAYLLGYLALFAPAGIGVREGFLIAFLRPEFGAAAVGVALLARVWMTVVELVPAFGFALWELFRSPGQGKGEVEDGK